MSQLQRGLLVAIALCKLKRMNHGQFNKTTPAGVSLADTVDVVKVRNIIDIYKDKLGDFDGVYGPKTNALYELAVRLGAIRAEHALNDISAPFRDGDFRALVNQAKPGYYP